MNPRLLSRPSHPMKPAPRFRSTPSLLGVGTALTLGATLRPRRRLAGMVRHRQQKHDLDRDRPARGFFPGQTDQREGGRGHGDHQELPVGRQARLAKLRHPNRLRRQNPARHQQRGAARPGQNGRPRQFHVFRREDRKVPLAAGHPQARSRQGVGLGVPRPVLIPVYSG